MKSRSCKNKGRRLVAELRQAILLSFPQLKLDDIQMVPTSVGGEDLKLSPAARLCWPFSTECKNQENIQIWKAMEQAKTNSNGCHPPAVVYSKNFRTPWVSVPLEVMLEILKRAHP